MKKNIKFLIAFIVLFLVTSTSIYALAQDNEEFELVENSVVIGLNEKININDFIIDANKSDGFYTFETGNESIVSVNEGAIAKGIGVGKTDIIIIKHIFVYEEITDEITGEKVTNKTERLINKTFKISVNKAPESVSLNAKNILLGVGQTFNLEYIIDSGSSYKKQFFSNSDDIASVNQNGIVKAKKEGKTKIKFKLFNGVSASCVVNVIKSKPKLKITDKNTKIQKGSDIHKLSYKFVADGANKTVKISSSDKKVLKIKKENLKGVKKGYATVIIKTKYDNISASKKFKVVDIALPLNCNSAQLAFDYSNVLRKKYGTSVKGRPLEAYIITNAKTGKYKKTLFMDFAVHGFEDKYDKDGKKLVEEANALIEYFANHSEELGKYRLVIVPCANPDGTIAGKNNKRACASAYGRCTAKHIDMNRDFKDFKAVESRKLKALIKSSKPNVYLNMHGWLNETLGTKKLCKIINKQQNFKKYIDSYGGNNGYIIGWVNKKLKIPCALVEYKAPDKISKTKDIKMIKKIIEAY